MESYNIRCEHCGQLILGRYFDFRLPINGGKIHSVHLYCIEAFFKANNATLSDKQREKLGL